MSESQPPSADATAGEHATRERIRVLIEAAWLADRADGDSELEIDDRVRLRAIAGMLAKAARADAARKASARVQELTAALHGVADHGWRYDGKVTFTINCVDVADAKRLDGLLRAALREGE